MVRRLEVLRPRQQHRDDHRADEPEARGGRQRPAPARRLGDAARQQPPGHAAEGGAADVQADGAGVGRGVQLLAEVRRRDGRQPGERDALQGAEPEQRGPARGQGAAQPDQGRQRERGVDEGRTAVAVGQRTGDQQGDGEPEHGGRERPGALPGVHAELLGERREQGLGAVEEREGGDARREQRDDDRGGSRPTPAGGRGGRCSGRGSRGPTLPVRRPYVQCVLRAFCMRVVHDDALRSEGADPGPRTPRRRRRPPARLGGRRRARDEPADALAGGRAVRGRARRAALRPRAGRRPDHPGGRARGRRRPGPDLALRPAGELAGPRAGRAHRPGPARVPRLHGHLAGAHAAARLPRGRAAGPGAAAPGAGPRDRPRLRARRRRPGHHLRPAARPVRLARPAGGAARARRARHAPVARPRRR